MTIRLFVDDLWHYLSMRKNVYNRPIMRGKLPALNPNSTFRWTTSRGLRLLLMMGSGSALVGCSSAPISIEPESLSIAETVYRIIVGGPSISEATLLRFYAWHLLGLGIPLLALIVWHGFRVRRDGGVSSPTRSEGEAIPPRTDREVIIRREWLTFFLTLASLIAISIFFDAPVGPAAEPGALVEHTKAPWIFLWVQELLRSWPPAIAGVLTPLVVVAILTFLPYADWSNDGVATWFNKQGRIPQILLFCVLLGILALTIRAALR